MTSRCPAVDLTGCHGPRDPAVAPLFVRWESSLFFGNGQGFAQQVRALVDEAETPVEWVVLDAEATSYADFTGTSSLHDLVFSLRDRGVTFGVAEPNGRFMEALEASGCAELIGSDTIFASIDLAARSYVETHPDAVAPSGTDAEQGAAGSAQPPGSAAGHVQP